MTAARLTVAERMAEVARLDVQWLRHRSARRFERLADLAHTSRAERDARAARAEVWLAEDERLATERLDHYVNPPSSQEATDHE
jgi:hypothetical protein